MKANSKHEMLAKSMLSILFVLLISSTLLVNFSSSNGILSGIHDFVQIIFRPLHLSRASHYFGAPNYSQPLWQVTSIRSGEEKGVTIDPPPEAGRTHTSTRLLALATYFRFDEETAKKYAANEARYRCQSDRTINEINISMAIRRARSPELVPLGVHMDSRDLLDDPRKLIHSYCDI